MKPNFIKAIKLNDRRFLHINLLISYPWIFFILSLPYLVWELFWAHRVGYACIKWHTHLMIYFYLWFAGYVVLYYGMSYKVYVRCITVYSAVLITLFLSELCMVALHIKETSSERLDSGYVSCYNSSTETWYHIWDANKPHWITKREYSYVRNANSLGFSDMEWPVAKGRNEKRILSLGDSFTEGDGAPYDSSYVYQLRKKCLSADSTIYIMNAGVCGSDPFFNFANYRDRLVIYHPDIIIQTLSSGDLNVDIATRGGLERFKEGGKVQYKRAPSWEPLFALSNLSRFFFSALGYNQLLIKSKVSSANKKEMDGLIVDLFKKYAALAKSNNCRLVVVLQPFIHEMTAGKYEYDFTVIEDELRKTDNIRICDLMPFYTSYIKSQNKTAAYYYWPQDGHHNAAGYTMMANGIYPEIRNE